MPSIAARGVAVLLRVVRANATFVDAGKARAHIEDRRIRPQPFAPPARLRGVHVALDRSSGWPIYTVTPSGSSSPGSTPGAAPRVGVVYLHGGAWVNEIVTQHWSLIAQIAREADVEVTVPIYPLAPFGTAGEVVEQVTRIALDVHGRLGGAVLAGDSAGGQIALSAALLLQAEHGVAPARTILISPALDLSFTNPGIPVVQPHDPWLARPGGIVYADLWRGELPVDDLRVSPLSGDLATVGPITVFSGTHDILNPDAHLLAERAEALGADLTYFEAPQQVHVYPLLPTPEGRAARRTLVEQVTGSLAPRR